MIPTEYRIDNIRGLETAPLKPNKYDKNSIYGSGMADDIGFCVDGNFQYNERQDRPQGCFPHIHFPYGRDRYFA